MCFLDSLSSLDHLQNFFTTDAFETLGSPDSLDTRHYAMTPLTSWTLLTLFIRYIASLFPLEFHDTFVCFTSHTSLDSLDSFFLIKSDPLEYLISLDSLDSHNYPDFLDSLAILERFEYIDYLNEQKVCFYILHAWG